MALTRIAAYFPEVVHSDPVTLVDEPGWLYAQTAETWWKGSLDADPVTVLLVYRSPLVTDTCRLYRPVADAICGMKTVEVIGQGVRPNKAWMGDRGEFLVARMTQNDAFPPGPLDMNEVRKIMVEAVGEAVCRALARVA
ncbi:hypothetical protein KIY87_gp29 [Mycobacterium phage Malec]|uniref:Uncharacterized protein n=2 Tax=Turbidovirus TaxID=2948936 RepID=A0A0A0RLX8_9CAUD|nr:hypothetical protein PBI_LARENN_71 [Mycobacterium phage Larenn]YP_010064163.1 hypothetical protein KIY87_gp29 [Mycobacterium phage Malec]AIW02966.1 hypothetical protein PBI_LARENN_71 [Mycobacterium phage Larenn]AZV00866.1 hypothetical protein SEA_MALEC_72 [Mycobacterium phage Malec]